MQLIFTSSFVPPCDPCPIRICHWIKDNIQRCVISWNSRMPGLPAPEQPNPVGETKLLLQPRCCLVESPIQAKSVSLSLFLTQYCPNQFFSLFWQNFTPFYYFVFLQHTASFARLVSYIVTSIASSTCVNSFWAVGKISYDERSLRENVENIREIKKKLDQNLRAKEARKLWSYSIDATHQQYLIFVTGTASFARNHCSAVHWTGSNKINDRLLVSSITRINNTFYFNISS